MEKEKVMHILSVLLDELKSNLWQDSIACWNMSGDEGKDLVLTLYVYENYSIPLSHLTKMILKFDVSTYNMSFRNNNGSLEILITLTND